MCVASFNLTLTLPVDAVITCTNHVWKLRHREVKWLVQEYMAITWQTWDINPATAENIMGDLEKMSVMK